jgi:hypothetical protein
MQATHAILDLWTLVRQSSTVDPEDLFRAIELEACRSNHDFRTRLLLRDSFVALSARWGRDGAIARLSTIAASTIRAILAENLGDPGFPTLESRLMQRTEPETMLQFLRELGACAQQDARIYVGGSGALILTGLLRRGTDDLDAVDEVPISLRNQHELLDSLAARYGLRLTHFRSHFLPAGWEQRVRSLGKFGKLDVHLVDPADIFLSKLFSAREKDLDDLRVLAPALGRSNLEARLNSHCGTLLGESSLRANADRNWYIVFGDRLPAG